MIKVLRWQTRFSLPFRMIKSGKNRGNRNKFLFHLRKSGKDIFCCAILFLISMCSYSFVTEDNSGDELKASCNVSLNSNGIASIPAFSLGKPAVVAAAGLAKGRFSLDPVLAYGLNFKPWYIDSWLHYMLVDRPVFKLRTGFNFSTYFSEYKLPEKQILQGERYWAVELAGFYYINSKSYLSLLYWNDRGQEPGTISGHYINFSGEISEIKAGKNLFFSANLQIFYIDYDGMNDGLFISPKVSSSINDLPIAVFIQATQVIKSNISPSPGFKWNIGLAYTF